MIKGLKSLKRKLADSGMRGVIVGIALFNILIVVLIFLFIFLNSIKFFNMYPAQNFFTGEKWYSLSGIFGFLPLLVGSLWVTIIALAISIPMSVMTSIYIAEFAGPKMREVLKVIIETMAAIPSVVLGFIALYIVADPIKNIFHLGTGLTALTGGIILAFMAMPTMVSIADDSLRALDRTFKEASCALGATKLQTIIRVLLPAAFPGIFAGVMLGFGRIIGETMTVLMVTGNSPNINVGPLSPVRTMTATIASEMGEVVQGSEHYYSLFAIGLILFIISFITNSIADFFIERSRKSMRG